MGYHLIIRHDDGTISTKYSESFNDLTEYSEISSDSIIYQGEKHWSPVTVGEDEHYRNLAHDWFRAGIKAQKLFKTQAIAHGLMIEELSQDVDSFKAYTSSSDVLIKRGDFLLRNVNNIEIETKCLTYYNNAFYIKYTGVKRHMNMQTFSGSPVVLAIYERDKDNPKPESLRMITIDSIINENNKSVEYNDNNKCLLVPISLTKPQFTLIDDVRMNIAEKIKYLTAND